MAIEESEIIDLIASYEGYEEECRSDGTMIGIQRAWLYRTIIKDLEFLLPRKTLADLDIPHYKELSGTIVEWEGMRGVLLFGSCDMVTLFAFGDNCVTRVAADRVYPLDEDRIWDERGNIL